MKTHKVVDLWNNDAIAFEGTLTECEEFADVILVSGFIIKPIEPINAVSELNDLINDNNSKKL